MEGLAKKVLAASPDRAVQVLEDAGLQVVLEHTAPPRTPVGQGGKERVVRLILRGKAATITIACEMEKDKSGKG